MEPKNITPELLEHIRSHFVGVLDPYADHLGEETFLSDIIRKGSFLYTMLKHRNPELLVETSEQWEKVGLETFVREHWETFNFKD